MANFDVSFMNPALRKTYTDQESGCVSSDQSSFELCKQSFELKQQNNILRSGTSINNSENIKNLENRNENLQSQINILSNRFEVFESRLNNLQNSKTKDFYCGASLILLVIMCVYLVVKTFRKNHKK